MPSLQFLLLEDSDLDAELIQAMLTDGEIECELVRVQTQTGFVDALKMTAFDLILSDYSLPNFDGIAALEIARSLCPDVPFILVSGTLGEEVAIETLKSGATDYVLKQRLGRLVPAVSRALREAQERRNYQQATAALRLSERHFRTLADAVPNFIWINNAQGESEYLNSRWQSFTGISAKQKLNWIEITHPDDAGRVIEKRMAGIRSGSPYEIECRIRRYDGVYRWHLVRVVPFKDDQDQLLYWYGTATDVDDAKRLYQQAEEANRIKDEFLAVLSHELRTPLNPIVGWSKLLRAKPHDPVTLARGLETIERNAQIQTQLIEDLLDVSRILRGKVSLNAQPTNLVTVIESALETVRLAAEAKLISLEFNPTYNTEINQSDHSNYITFGDSSRLQQIIWNLLSNAVKFTPNHGRVEIELTTDATNTADRRNAKITVRDTGKGIAPHFLPYVFDSFRQADGSTTRTFGGLGLGLAIVRHLIELHGGTINAASPGEGQGATFIVTLPMLKGGEKTLKREPRESSLSSLALEGLRILVVDDEQDSLDWMTVLLEQSGAIVRSALSAETAIAAITEFKPDILLSDIGMPEEDGYMLLERVRSCDGGQIPAIALTAYARAEDRERAIAAGFQDHLTKPIDPKQLISAIDRLCCSVQVSSPI
ncbi:PAS domain S-box protein [Phormidesmis priestleyi ULC007]|uniref:Circadian input-output histidine kinase CikA n=1 Tax=Phormidesmis priestleyi ULC007 TaxID=1920490 RepID=A0A2T1DIT4_9CYAN|nr:response regulator [Phormidesmis priestleyi]PSB20420.1 PAS domain S-box protein [Phormidesmis priestleyi ULC007]PZO52996.1 MAG: PAS domain S-box protein [Phormidesmis priestleyi]